MGIESFSLRSATVSGEAEENCFSKLPTEVTVGILALLSLGNFLKATSTCRQLYDLRDYAFYLIEYKIPLKKDSDKYHEALEYLHSLVSSQNDASLTTDLAKLRVDVKSKHKEIKKTISSTAFKYFLSFKGSTEYIPLSRERTAINRKFNAMCEFSFGKLRMKFIVEKRHV